MSFAENRGAAGVVFVLHDSSRTLYVLTGMAELYRHDVSEMFGAAAVLLTLVEPRLFWTNKGARARFQV
ncbi:hypothetical protein [Burkholderia sp. F1]|uniref:hypothetical protein n=1 Tax=Burkholderia sp. F1 TaxID=3366817 RepID=UPI003D764203